MADASSTILLTFRRLASFRDEFVCQGAAGFPVLSNAPSRALQAPIHRRDPEFVVFHSQNHFISGLDAKRFPIRGGYHYTAVFVDPHPGFDIHCGVPKTKMTLSYYMSLICLLTYCGSTDTLRIALRMATPGSWPIVPVKSTSSASVRR